MTIQAYPLCWAQGWPRTRAADRRYGRFSTKDTARQHARTKDITLAQARDRVLSEIQSMDGPGRNWNRIDPDSIIELDFWSKTEVVKVKLSLEVVA